MAGENILVFLNRLVCGLLLSDKAVGQEQPFTALHPPPKVCSRLRKVPMDASLSKSSLPHSGHLGFGISPKCRGLNSVKGEESQDLPGALGA